MLSCGHFFIHVHTLGGPFNPLLLFAACALTISPCTFYSPTTTSLECGHHLPLLLSFPKALHTRLVNLLTKMRFPPWTGESSLFLGLKQFIKASVVGTSCRATFSEWLHLSRSLPSGNQGQPGNFSSLFQTCCQKSPSFYGFSLLQGNYIHALATADSMLTILKRSARAYSSS